MCVENSETHFTFHCFQCCHITRPPVSWQDIGNKFCFISCVLSITNAFLLYIKLSKRTRNIHRLVDSTLPPTQPVAPCYLWCCCHSLTSALLKQKDEVCGKFLIHNIQGLKRLFCMKQFEVFILNLLGVLVC